MTDKIVIECRDEDWEWSEVITGELPIQTDHFGVEVQVRKKDD